MAKDGITIYVHPSNGVAKLSLAQLKGIYMGTITNWSQVGGKNARILVYGRENSSGTYAFFKEHVLKGYDFGGSVQTLPGTAAVVNAVAKDANGIGYGGFGYAKGVKICQVSSTDGGAGITPSEQTINNGSYPISRYLYIYLKNRPTGALKSYVDWIISAEGQAVVRKTGYFPLLRRVFEGELFRLYSDESRPRRAPFWTPMHLDLSQDFRVLTFAAPVGARGVRRGLVATELAVTELTPILTAIETPGTAVSVIDQTGEVLATSSLSLAAEGIAFLSKELTSRLNPGFNGVIDGQNIAVTTVEGTPWRIVTMTPDSEIRRRALHAVIPYALSLAGVFATLAIVLLLLQHQMIRPAARLASYIAAEARGEAKGVSLAGAAELR